MTSDSNEIRAELERLRARVAELEDALSECHEDNGLDIISDPLVRVPEPFRQVFEQAQVDVSRYFLARREDPLRALLSFSEERYILVRAASMSTEFFELVASLYQDRGEHEARQVAFSVLFDVAHALGKADAAAFEARMGVEDALERLSAGPVNFAWSGWARVVIHPESTPSPDEHYFLSFDHEHSFEAEAWMKRGTRTHFPVCVMNAGYSSGWCEQCFGIPLVSVEISCRAMGDEHCRFIMAPPSTIPEHLARLEASGIVTAFGHGSLEVPEFFRRKRLEDRLRRARDELEDRVHRRTDELNQRNEQLRQANERLAGAYRAREEFIAMVSHELRTPLVTGLGYLELLLAGKFGELSTTANASMKVAFRNLRRLSALVEEILHYQQLAHPTGPAPALVPLDLSRLCRESVEDFRVRTGRPEVSVRVEVPTSLPPVLADDEMLRQVLANLLNNAHTHGGPDVLVTLRAEASGEHALRVAVIDEGAGMPPDIQRHATEPFVRRGQTPRGLGLGLAIVQQLVRAHGSELTVASRQGEGTTLSFELRTAPRAEASGEYRALSRRARRPNRPATSAAAGIHMLVVEDDEDTREFLDLVLRQEGYRVTTVATAEEALVALDMQQPVHAWLVDVHLPGMSGCELCQQLKGRVPGNGPPVFLITARADPSTRQECEASGCDAMLLKPLDLEALRNLVFQAPSRPPVQT